jgi:hypothetical protein
MGMEGYCSLMEACLVNVDTEEVAAARAAEECWESRRPNE